MNEKLIALRREFHRYPESGWTEFRTTVRIIEELERLELPVRYGKAIHAPEKMHGLPAPEVLERCYERALAETNRPDLLEEMHFGFTGCVTVIEGDLPGDTVGLRVDIDCNEVTESREASHVPVAEGFRSVHEGLMHACGHDAHITIGLGAAKLLCENRHRLRGRVVLAFQPAEEGLRGAASLAAAGVFDDCRKLYGIHVGLLNAPVGTVAASVTGVLASSKFDVAFHGKAAHAALSPELGRNALAAAAKATLDMLAIPPIPGCVSRINVGTLHGGSGRNVIPAEAVLQAETRASTTRDNEQLSAEAMRRCQAAAAHYGCTCEIMPMGGADDGVCDEALAARAAEVLQGVPGVTTVLPSTELSICEDITTLMAAVRARGGQATELIAAMPLTAPHHNDRFDVDERVIELGVRILGSLVLEA